jgi:hypothetical protein
MELGFEVQFFMNKNLSIEWIFTDFKYAQVTRWTVTFELGSPYICRCV